MGSRRWSWSRFILQWWAALRVGVVLGGNAAGGRVAAHGWATRAAARCNAMVKHASGARAVSGVRRGGGTKVGYGGVGQLRVRHNAIAVRVSAVRLLACMRVWPLAFFVTFFAELETHTGK